MLNADDERPCPLPTRSGLFLRNAGDRWEPLPLDGATYSPNEVNGLRPVTGGTVRSIATSAIIDLASAWETLLGPA